MDLIVLINMNFLTIHYNTPELTEALIKSLDKYVKKFTLYVFDNSDQKPLVTDNKNVIILDNTKGQIFNLDTWLDKFPNKQQFLGATNRWGSARHIKSVDICFDLIPEGFILLDSDTLLEKNPKALWDETKVFSGQIDQIYAGEVIKRVNPLLCYINVPMCKENNIRFCNEDYTWMITDKDPNKWYDTGAWFYKACVDANLPFKEINRREYILHYGSASWNPKKTDIEKQKEWLYKHRRVLE